MKKSFFLSIFFFLLFFKGTTQSWDWAAKFDAAGKEWKTEIGGVDQHGNTYLTVAASSNSHRDPWTNYYLVKYDRKGSLVWSKMINEYMMAPIVTDLVGRTYLASQDKLVCFSDGGEELWQKTFNAMFRFAALRLANNSLFTTGVDYGNDTARAFVAYFDLMGEMQQFAYGQYANAYTALDVNMRLISANIGLVGNGYCNCGTVTVSNFEGNILDSWIIPHTVTQILTDSKSNIFITGWHDIYPVTIANNEFVTPGKYIVKYDAKGNLLWYRNFTGIGATALISLDNDDNLYYSSTYFQECSINGQKLTSNGRNLIVIKYNPDGELIWLLNSPGEGKGFAKPVATYVRGDDIYLAGTIKDRFLFGAQELQADDTYTELFVAKLSQKYAVGLRDTQENPSSIRIHPNPSGARFSVQCPQGSFNSVRYTVTDTQGKKIANAICADVQSFDVNLSGQPAGIYFLEVFNGIQRTVHKLVRQ